ncbi:BlaI/MecI/CopY family transcriptional regulator [Streptomyces sp. NPDC054864]
MSDVQPESAGVQAQYAARVTADLETNRKEQERVGAQVTALQEQLRTLENDHALLLSMQQALGSTGAPAATAKKPSSRASTAKKAVPAPRASANNSGAARTKKATANKAKDNKEKTAKAAKSAPRTGAKKSAESASGPTLVELIDNHLAQQGEPRSAAEITSALAQELPDRTIKTTVVRTTVEGLVAKGRAQRTKQGSSVFYTAAAPAASAPAPQSESATS